MCIDCLVEAVPCMPFDVIVDNGACTAVYTTPALCKVHAYALAVNSGGIPREFIKGISMWPFNIDYNMVHMRRGHA